MSFIEIPRSKPGDTIVQHNDKEWEDYKAQEGEKALVLMHTVPFEGSVGLINLLTCTRLVRKGYDTTLLLYGPGVLMATDTRGFPNVGDEAFPGNQSLNNQIKTIIKEGGKVVACRFAMSALYGHREQDMIEGVKVIHPLDILDCVIEHHRAGALVLNTWTV
jgi:uncharacterized repeat protein (TIGR04044 family)